MLNCGTTALTISLAPVPAAATASTSDASSRIAVAFPAPTWPATNPARSSL